MKYATLAMARARSIVSIASVAGMLSGMGPHAYTASKHVVVGLTKSVACELGAHGIRVNCVSPFEFGPRGRPWCRGSPDQGAEDVVPTG